MKGRSNAGTDRSTERLARALVRLVPRSLREDFGEAMVQLARDRRRHGGEPLWRLWPSLVADTSSTAVKLRWEEAVFPIRALLIGLGVAVVALAVLSGDPIVGGLVAPAVAAVVVGTRPSSAEARTDHRWVPWVGAGAALCTLSVVLLIVLGSEEMAPIEWMATVGSMFLGWAALGTGAAIALGHRSPRRA